MAWRCALCSKDNGRFDVACQTCSRPKGHVPANAAWQHHERCQDDTCCVCWEKTSRRTECGHAVCSACWRKLPDRNKCPMCRITLVVAADAVEDADCDQATGNASPSGCTSSCSRTVGGGRRVIEQLRTLVSRPGLTLPQLTFEAAKTASTMEHLYRMRLVADPERETFYSELRAAVRSQVSRLGQLSETTTAEALLLPLRARCIIGDSEVGALRRRAAQLVPHRRVVRAIAPCENAADTRFSSSAQAAFSEAFSEEQMEPPGADAGRTFASTCADSESSLPQRLKTRCEVKALCVGPDRAPPRWHRASRPAWWLRYSAGLAESAM